MNKLLRWAVAIPLLWVSAHAETWPLKDVKWPSPTDSVRMKVYEDGVLLGEKKKSGVQSFDTTLTISQGHRYDVTYLIYYTGSDVAATWVFSRDLVVPGGLTYSWHITEAQWGQTADSAQLRYYADTVALRGSTVAKRGSGVSTYDTTLTAYVGKWNQANILIWFPNTDSAATWSWVWDLTDTTAGGTVTTPTNPNRSLVYAKIIKNDGRKDEIYGATVEAVRTGSVNAAANASGVNVMIAGLPTYATVDSSGYWQMYLIGTHEFTADTSRGFYNIKCTGRNGTELFNLQKVWIPSSGALNLSDTLNARNQ